MKKTLSFAVIHFSVAFSVGYLFTGSVLVGGALALLEPTLNTLAFHLHEKFWNRLESAEAVSDEPTADLLTQRMQVHEKNAWMLRSMVA
jgi:uncharacterized membrane protein